MEGLFNLIAESPLLLFFVIAAIISFLRSRGGEEEQKKQSGQPQTRQERPSQQKQQTQQRGSKDQEVDWKDIFRQETRPTEPQPSASRSNRQYETRGQSEPTVSSLPRGAEEELKRSKSELNERYERIQKQKQKAIEKGSLTDNSPITNNDLTLQKKDKIKLDFSKISRDEAVKGVIWSEILGKPKSRRKQIR
ncbi:hypothetical protein [Salipaludibacillus daqingensis]|uniref:hypothetical protein n=1 Tax=Salipaludibacillus daqingensis TaxID=3041001 RepID=UPI002476FBD1|nr:hypothetical protein [Salipaludibacillus daqingensis]